jgi:ketosteroid isomerase-like protein
MNKAGAWLIVVLAVIAMVSFNVSVLDDSRDNASALVSLQEELQALQSRTQALHAESEIRHKLQTYMPVLAAADWDAYVDFFMPDGKIIMAEGTRTGRDDIKERMASASARMAAAAAESGAPVRKRAELLSNVEVEVTSAITANAASRFVFLAETGNGGFEVTGSGRYLDEWALDTDGEWRIAARTVDYDLLRAPAQPPDPARLPAQ